MALALAPQIDLGNSSTPRPVEVGLPLGLPLTEQLRDLLPAGVLRRGGCVGIAGGVGQTSLLLTLLSGPMAQAGCWSAIIGLPDLGPEAAAGCGIPLEHLALIPDPGEAWLEVTGALLDSLDIVVLYPPRRATPTDARRLMSRARQRQSVLVIVGSGWPDSPDVILEATDSQWEGLSVGHGSLRHNEVTVRTSGRRLHGPAKTARINPYLPSAG